MSRPSFQFYPGDWRKNANLGRCSKAARGAWIDVLCVLHDSDEYGVARYPLRELANASACPIVLLRELVAKGVLKGAEDGEQVEAFIYRARHAGKEGPPVDLVPAQPGPLWYSSRMVKDEHVRRARGEGTRFGDDGGPSPIKGAKPSPTQPIGDGPSSSSSSSPSGEEISHLPVAPARPASEQLALVPGPGKKSKAPDCPHVDVLALWAEVLPAMPQHDPERWRGAKADHLRVRWRETAIAKRWPDKAAGLAYFRKLFRYVGQSQFLTGRAPPSAPGKRPFVIELEWLVVLANWDKVHEGKYHPEQAA